MFRCVTTTVDRGTWSLVPRSLSQKAFTKLQRTASRPTVLLYVPIDTVLFPDFRHPIPPTRAAVAGSLV